MGVVICVRERALERVGVCRSVCEGERELARMLEKEREGESRCVRGCD